ncbi:DUF3592 domain-containing protein [Streptomyces sp. NBC_01136]|uniref:DUF3592 domain-containing protein n=1 Tax=unclassified Streptomyces TaxID=2593676 RepID=UPI0032548A46|nr:DUF3592 domain-containing protein [Streptomyces sp. NBC_01136]
MVVHGIVQIAVGILVILSGVRLAIEGDHRAARALRRGRVVTAQVTETKPGGTTMYQPYTAYPPSLRLRYELDGKTREGTLWLEKSKHTQYQVGQTLQVCVSGSLVKHLRSTREANTYGNLWEAGGALLILGGLAVAVTGIVLLIRRA